MSRRQAIVLTPAEHREMLETSHTAILSSLDPGGYPHSVPMWYVVDRDESLLMTTYAKSQKALNLARNPRCSVVVEAGREYHELRGVLVRGNAHLSHDVDAIRDTLARIRRKHGLAFSVPEIADAIRDHAAKRVLIRIVPARVATWDHRKLGGIY